jgi:hypothetical protein
MRNSDLTEVNTDYPISFTEFQGRWGYFVSQLFLCFFFFFHYITDVTRFLLQDINFQLSRVQFNFHPFIEQALSSTYPLIYGSFTAVMTGQQDRHNTA